MHINEKYLGYVAKVFGDRQSKKRGKWITKWVKKRISEINNKCVNK